MIGYRFGFRSAKFLDYTLGYSKERKFQLSRYSNCYGEKTVEAANLPAGEEAILGDDEVRRAVDEVAAVLREASWGRTSWQDACRLLAAALPGSAPSIVNYDLPRAALNSSFVEGVDPDLLASYVDHYHAVNPWLDFWATARDRQIKLSERAYPSELFRNTEFYADWLSRQPGLLAAAGFRIEVDPHTSVHVAWHYDLARAPTYDLSATAILTGLVGAIGDSVRDAAILGSVLEKGPRLGSMIDQIDGAAMLVDRDRRIREANAEATAAFADGGVVTGAAGCLGLRDPAAHRWLETTLPRVIDRLPVTSTMRTFIGGGKVFQITLTPAPEYAEPNAALLIRPRPQVLVTVRLLVGKEVELDKAALRFAFGLSEAEMRLCELLSNGHSLAETARLLGVSDGTVRQRIKLVFNKTQTHRQGELIGLLSRFDRRA